MTAAKCAHKRLNAGLIIFALLLSFAAMLDASSLEQWMANAPDTVPHTPEAPAPAPKAPSLPPIVNAPFDWFKGLSDRNQRLVTIIFCVVMMLTGIFFVIFGYRIFRPTLAMVGFVIVFVLLWVVLTTHAEKLKWWAILLISLACAILAALLCFFVYHVGIALLGFALGFTIATLILSTPLGTKIMTNYWAHFSIILVTSLAFSVLAIIFQRLIIIIGTSSLGAYLFCNAIDIAWLHTGILSNILVHFFSKDFTHIPPINTTPAYGLLGGDLALFLFGVLVQFGITARHYDHRKHLGGSSKRDDEREGLLVNQFYRD